MEAHQHLVVETVHLHRQRPEVRGSSNSPGSRRRQEPQPAGVVVGTANGSFRHSAKPHTPNDGTAAWYGRTAYPAASSVRTTHQYDVRANSGDVHCTATAAPGASRRESLR